MAGKCCGSESDLVPLKGFNPDGVCGVVLKPTDDCEVYVVPDRALEVLDVLIDSRPVMYRNPAGHRASRSWSGAGLNPIRHIEAGFTAGLENVGAPQGDLPLHGTFSVTPARQWQRTETGGVRGTIDCRRMVTGPSIIVERTVEPVPGRRAYRITDRLQAEVGSDYMWLYHPNFPVVDGTQLISSETFVMPRDDGIAEKGLETYRTFSGVGRGHTRWPPGTEAEAVAEENFEQCYIMRVEPDDQGVVRAMLVAPDRGSAATVSYNLKDLLAEQRMLHFWKNPRDGSSSLEVGSTFLGWEFARTGGLLSSLATGQERTYEIEVGFLRSRQEVDAFADAMPQVGEAERQLVKQEDMARVYGS